MSIDYLSSNDNVGQGHLANGFNITCHAWRVRDFYPVYLSPTKAKAIQSRFRVPYMHGCPVPGDSVGQKLKHIFASNNQPDQPLIFISPSGSNDNPGSYDEEFGSGRRTSATSTDDDRRNDKGGQGRGK